ncbi:Cell surface protein with LPXTG-motif (fragment) [Latilactobacillus fuchuensis]|uniref:Cell surface protein with LPXTG-motif n=2 Tax=Latilactobacillus fuchuensis TaxID=164393 RepID=A0A2N9DXH1_9LACO
MVKTNATADDVFTDDAQTITYHYAKIGKDVTVNYVDAAGKKLATSKTLSGNVGDKVNAEEAKVGGYAMVKTNATADDVFTDDVQTITYHYAKIGKDVTVNYVDAAGKELATSKTLSGNVGDKVNSEAVKVAGYAMVKTNATDDDVFTDDAQTITYHYAKIGKDVTVNYVDAAGKKLATSKTLSGNVGDKVNAEEAKVAGYAMVKTNATANDVFTDDAQTITYQYAKIGKDVTVNYVDADGKKLAESKTLSGNVGDKVNAEEAKVEGYAMVKTNATADDVFTDDVQTITYHYVKKADNVTVKYVDESGNEIAPAKALTGNVGAAYQAVQASIDGYTYKQVTDNAKGTFTDKPQTVTYVYTKNPVAGANVTVNYQDESGNQLAKPAILTGNVGAAYQAVQASITGYTYKQVIGQPTGTFSNAAQTVTYVYTKNPVAGANVTVNYQDEAGKQLAASAILTGNIDTSYHAVQATITGYHYKAVTGAPDGRFTANAQTVTYVYTKDADKPVKIANQTVKYVDENGQTIAGTEILTGNIGTPYHAIQKAVAGYSYKSVTGAPTGNFTTDAPTVTYIYTKDPVQGANVTVNYQDEAGKQIANPATLSGNVGSGYQAVQTPIDGYTFKQVIGTPTGTFSNAAQTVTYVYTKNPVQAGNVTVNYQDEAGNQLAKSATLTGNVGDNYQAVQLAVDGYTFQKVIGNPNGTLTDAAQSVTYVYAKTVTKPEASTTPIEQPKQPVKQPKTTTDQTPSEKVAPAAKTTKVADDRQKLPQTGVKQANGLLAVVGALLIAIVGMAFKKRKN